MATYTEKRRKTSWYPILGFAIFAGLGAGLIGFAKPIEKIDNYWTVAEISNEESTIVREVIDYNFGNEADVEFTETSRAYWRNRSLASGLLQPHPCGQFIADSIAIMAN